MGLSTSTKYFQLLSNGKNRKRRIFQLQDDDKIIEGDEALKKYITSYYKGLFGSPVENNFRLDGPIKDGFPQVTDRENEILIKPFTEDEEKSDIFQMENNKSPSSLQNSIRFFWSL
jgi:hypothetical protein